MTKAANQALLGQIPFEDKRDFEKARRGLMAPLPNNGAIKADGGRVVWDMTRFDFIEDGCPAPDSVNSDALVHGFRDGLLADNGGGP